MNPLAHLATVFPPTIADMIPVAIEAQSLLHALGWTLLHFCWQGALIAVLLWCVLALLSERTPQQRYIAACTALMLMAVLPLVTFTQLITASHGDAHAIIVFVPLDPAAIQGNATLQGPSSIASPKHWIAPCPPCSPSGLQERCCFSPASASGLSSRAG
jgi:hypothetical protein